MSVIPTTTPEPLRICVVCADYSGSDGALSEVDNIDRTPAFHCKDPRYVFETLTVHKKDVYFMLRKAATKTHPTDRKRRYYDCFFIISDGALDEDRAGVEVLHVLERFGCAFTGARSGFYELTKPEMKVLAMRNNISTARFAVIEATDDVRACCSRLNFPLIVKHISGYSSVGMTKKNKVKNMEELEEVTKDFIAEYQSALVEEFVTGLEVTALACGDSTQPGGCRVYPPVYVTFPEGEDFKHFDLKWIAYEGMVWKQLPDDHPAMEEIQRVTRVAFQSMMNGVGYGRVDLRIDAETNKVVFLELNPNCGIMYPLGQEASADYILDLASAREDFVKLQIHEALAFQRLQQPMFQVRLDGSRELGWTTRATRHITSGTTILSLAGSSNPCSNYQQYQQKVYRQHQLNQQQQKQQEEQENKQHETNNGEKDLVGAQQQQQQNCVGVRLIQQEQQQENNSAHQQQQEVITQLQSVVPSASSHRSVSLSPENIQQQNQQNQQNNNNNIRTTTNTTPNSSTNNNNNNVDVASETSSNSVCIFPSVTMVPLLNNNSNNTNNAIILDGESPSNQSTSSPIASAAATVASTSVHQHQQQEHSSSCASTSVHTATSNRTTVAGLGSSQMMKFGLALNDPLLTCSHIIGGGIPFPKANANQQQQQTKQMLETPNVVFDCDSLSFIATADIKEGEEILC